MNSLHTLPFVLRAGSAARTQIQNLGFNANSLAALGAPAGGPKFIIQSYLDRFLFGEWLPQRVAALPAFGSSIGAFRLLAGAHPDPAAAAERLYVAYCQQHYASKPTAQEITREVGHILNALLQKEHIPTILQHPWLQLNLLTTRCLGLAAAKQPAWQALGFALAFGSNLRSRQHLAQRFERCVFQNQTEAPGVLAKDSFRTHYHALTPENLATVTLASGSIPLVMETVRDIPNSPEGAHIDGGMLDYHMDLPLQNIQPTAGILFIPHYEQRIVSGWFDKHLKRRQPSHHERMLVLSPSPEVVAKLPGGKIPCRKDFTIYHGRDRQRLAAWQAALTVSEDISGSFQHLLKQGTIGDHLQAL